MAMTKDIESKVKKIRMLEDEIKAMQASCPHEIIRHKMYADCYSGQGESRQCENCKMPISLSTTSPTGEKAIEFNRLEPRTEIML